MRFVEEALAGNGVMRVVVGRDAGSSAPLVAVGTDVALGGQAGAPHWPACVSFFARLPMADDCRSPLEFVDKLSNLGRQTAVPGLCFARGNLKRQRKQLAFVRFLISPEHDLNLVAIYHVDDPRSRYLALRSIYELWGKD